MTSLKHLLNDQEESESSTPPLTSQSTLDDDSPLHFSQNEPGFSEGNWFGLFNELFGSDTGQGNCFDPSLDDAFLFAEDSVEQWAIDNVLPEVQDVSFADVASGSGISGEVADDEIVCYGMLYRVMVKLEGDMFRLKTRLLDEDVPRVSRLVVLPIRRAQALQSILELPDKTCFAQVNTNHSTAFDALLQRPGFELEAFLDPVQFLQTIDSASKAKEATMRVSINVYGYCKDREVVGKQLSDAKVFLQEPDNPRVGCRVDNPHFYETSGSGCDVSRPLLREEDTRPDTEDSEQALKETVADLYSSLRRGQNLIQIDGDACLQTRLLSHQQKALDFMTQRETGPVPEEFCLWQESNEGGQTVYRHSITKAMLDHRPSETGGGVLADTMGLGKTLSILALVAKTRAEASSWSTDESLHSELRIPSRATLVIVPSFLLLNHWEAEIGRHLDTSFVVRKYHGPRREKLPDLIAQSDIVLTTYFTISEEIRSSKCLLCDIAWFRVVLDEAHIIRRRATTLYRTVSQLRGKYRWCLTGTPIQNRLEDVGALFCYVGVPPFDRMPYFKKYIIHPYEEKHEQRAKATKRLRLLFDSLCLRRTKKDVDDNLPNQSESLRRLDLSDAERRQYDATKEAMFRAIRQKVGALDKNDFGMFQAQMHLRLLCNHGTFQNPFSWTKQRNMNMEREVALEFFGHTGEVVCSSCTQSLPITGYSTNYQSWTGSCRHIVCNECMSRYGSYEDGAQDMFTPDCPICLCSGISRSHGTKLTDEMQKQEEEFFRPTGISTKMNALVQDLRQDLWSSKSLVFSFWTRTLDLIERHLKDHNIPFLRIDGTTPPQLRQRMLDLFSTSGDHPVLMMTTGTGAFGLNLPAANRVFIVEPLFNPATERQAIARAVRLGQRHDITVIRYLMNSTVEQEMRDQQDNKLKLAEVGWSG